MLGGVYASELRHGENVAFLHAVLRHQPESLRPQMHPRRGPRHPRSLALVPHIHHRRAPFPAVMEMSRTPKRERTHPSTCERGAVASPFASPAPSSLASGAPKTCANSAFTSSRSLLLESHRRAASPRGLSAVALAASGSPAATGRQRKRHILLSCHPPSQGLSSASPPTAGGELQTLLSLSAE